MESERFDSITRSVANRRQMMRKLGGSGLIAATASILGVQRVTSQNVPCALQLRATVRIGPTAGELLTTVAAEPGTLNGELQLVIAPNGTLGDSVLDLEDGATLPVRGQAAGFHLAIRIGLSEGRAMVLQGVAEQPLELCQGVIDGSLTGPLEGDLGDWHAETAAAESASNRSTGSSAGENAQVSTSIPPTTPTATETTTPVAQPTATCTPATYADFCSTTMCGDWDDGCGGNVDCGFPCANIQVCYLGYCCYPQEEFVACQGKCGQIVAACGEVMQCADCPAGFSCSNEQCCGDTGTFCQVNVDCCSGDCSMLNGCG